jgi:hypothetical protein
MTFAEILAAWYGPDWRRIAPPALGRSRRTIFRWCADGSRVPRWAWRRFTSDRVPEKWREIDRRAAAERARSHLAQGQRKSAVHAAARVVAVKLEGTRFGRAKAAQPCGTGRGGLSRTSAEAFAMLPACGAE